jgi:hypothetical protein
MKLCREDLFQVVGIFLKMVYFGVVQTAQYDGKMGYKKDYPKLFYRDVFHS